MNWYLYALKNVFTYRGRARRAEFGWFTLIHFFVQIGILLLNWVSSMIPTVYTFQYFSIASLVIGALAIIYQIIAYFASLSLTTRRLHDLGLSGWWQLLIALLPWILIIGIFGLESLLSPMDNGYISEPNHLIFQSILIISVIIIVLSYLMFTLILFFKDGQRFDNRFGKDPKVNITASSANSAMIENLRS